MYSKRKFCLLTVVLFLLSTVAFAGPNAEQSTVQSTAEGLQYGGTLTYFQTSNEANSPDPCSPASELIKQLNSPVLDPLIMMDFETYGPRGTDEWPFEVHELQRVPQKYWKGALAESWEVTRDKIIFNIRPGVAWATYGKEAVMESRDLTADDVVFSLVRFHDEWNDREYYTENGGWIDDIYAEGNSVVVEISYFAYDWIRWLGGGEFVIYPPEVLEAGMETWNTLVGTGPFMFEEYVAGSHLGFVKNPDYWGTTTIDNKVYDDIPFVDELRLTFIKDESTKISALRTGKLDICPRTSVKQENSLAKSTPELKLLKALNNWQSLVALRCDAEPFNDKKVRQAMMIGLDLPALSNAAFYDGEMYPWLIAPSSPDFVPLEEQGPGAQKLYTYDPDLAKQMLAEAGYPNGFEVKAVCASTGGRWAEGGRKDSEILQMAAGYWEKIGVETEIVVLEPVAYEVTRQKVEYDGYDLRIDNVGNEAFFHPIQKYFSGYVEGEFTFTWNGARYWNPEVTELYLKAYATIDPKDRDAIWKQAADLLYDSAAYISVGAPYLVTYWWPWVSNYYGEQYSSRSGYAHILASLWLDQNMKAEMGY